MARHEVEALLSKYPREVREVVAAARAYLKRVLPDIDESVDRSTGLIGYSYGPGYKGLVCTLILSRTGVKLGIVRGAELPDPKGLMAGRGKVHRHVQLSSVADLKRSGLMPLLKRALRAWRTRAPTALALAIVAFAPPRLTGQDTGVGALSELGARCERLAPLWPVPLCDPVVLVDPAESC